MIDRETAIASLAGSGHVMRCANCGRTFHLSGRAPKEGVVCPYCKTQVVDEPDEPR